MRSLLTKAGHKTKEKEGILNPYIQRFQRSLGELGAFGLFLVLVFRLPLKHQGLEAGCRLQELVDQWSDSVWQVLCSYNKGEITANHFVCIQIQGHIYSLSLLRGLNFQQ